MWEEANDQLIKDHRQQIWDPAPDSFDKQDPVTGVPVGSTGLKRVLQVTALYKYWLNPQEV